MSSNARIPRRITSALINSLGAGVTPRVGLNHIVVGRKRELGAILDDLNTVSDGGAAFRLIVGRYGSGKSFLLQLSRNHALERDFVVADADFSPDRRLTGAKGQGLATYRELVGNLATRTRPDGQALPSLLERWISTVQNMVVKEDGVSHSDATFTDRVERRILLAVEELESFVHGFDFARVIAGYWRGYRESDEGLQGAAVRWLRGEYTSKLDARRDLGVRVIIDDDTWYDYVKLLARFVQAAGYGGLVIVLDEAVNLYKIPHTISRTNNYEKLLSIVNDTLQGKASHLAVLIGGTPRFLDDTRRGLFSYDALRTRLQGSRFVPDGMTDMNGPVIHLPALADEEVFLLLQRIREVHEAHHGSDSGVNDEDLIAFMQLVVNQLGASDLLTPRDLVRDLVGVLNLLRQHSSATFRGLIGAPDFHATRGGHEAGAVEDAEPDDFAELEL